MSRLNVKIIDSEQNYLCYQKLTNTSNYHSVVEIRLTHDPSHVKNIQTCIYVYESGKDRVLREKDDPKTRKLARESGNVGKRS